MQRDAHMGPAVRVSSRYGYRKRTRTMKPAPRVHESKVLPFYAIGCFWVGAAIFIAAGLRDASLGAAIAGIGFAVYGVSTYRDPVVFRRPLLAALEPGRSRARSSAGSISSRSSRSCGLLVL
jgi:hypothetical protein